MTLSNFDPGKRLSERMLRVCAAYSKTIEAPERGSTETVDQFEWRVFRSSAAYVEFGGLGPCLGIMLYCPRTKITAAGHFTEPENYDKSSLDDMLKFAAEFFPSMKNLQVHLGGLSESRPARSAADARNIRKDLVARLRALGCADIRHTWAIPSNVVDLTIHLQSGTVKVLDETDN